MPLRVDLLGRWRRLCDAINQPAAAPADEPYLDSHPNPDQRTPAEERFAQESAGAKQEQPLVTHTWRW